MKTPDLTLLDVLQTWDRLLTTDDVLNIITEEDLMLRELDKAGVIFPLKLPLGSLLLLSLLKIMLHLEIVLCTLLELCF